MNESFVSSRQVGVTFGVIKSYKKQQTSLTHTCTKWNEWWRLVCIGQTVNISNSWKLSMQALVMGMFSKQIKIQNCAKWNLIQNWISWEMPRAKTHKLKCNATALENDNGQCTELKFKSLDDIAWIQNNCIVSACTVWVLVVVFIHRAHTIRWSTISHNTTTFRMIRSFHRANAT